jgi:predicted ester cyclase
VDAREVLLALAEAASRHDLDAVAQVAGNDRLQESFGRLLTAFPDVVLTPEWTVLEGDRAVAWAHITGTHQGEWRGLAPTGKPIDVHGMIAVSLAGDGSVADFWLVNDWLGIATQLGVRLELPAT